MAKTRTSWKKGQSGNPKGQPKASYSFAELFQQALEEQKRNKETGITKSLKEWLAETMIREALKGNLVAAREIMDRMEGKPKQSTEITGKDGGVLEIKITRTENWQDPDYSGQNLTAIPTRSVSSPNGNP